MKLTLACIILTTIVLQCQSFVIRIGRDENLVLLSRHRRNIKKVETINNIVDIVLREIKPIMKKNGMDPFLASNIKQSLYLTYVTMNNMLINNLTTIYRDADVVVLDYEDDRKMKINVRLGFKDIQLISDYKMSMFLIASMGKLTATIAELFVEFKLVTNFKALNIQITDFKLVNGNQTMKLRFSGNVESILINIGTLLVIRIVNNVILSIVQGPIKTQINNVLNVINIILESTLSSIPALMQNNI